jgi:LCP family protein required for cell wall assembly
VIKTVALVLAGVLVVVAVGGFLAYRHLENNITTIDTHRGLGTDRPDPVEPVEADRPPLNLLLLGSDTREGQTGHIGGETPGLSDTTILLHLSADRETAYGVSIPRDSMVERPDCLTDDGETVPGGFGMFNAAYALGGPLCTQRTVEQLTGIRIDHVVVVDFNGFRAMVDALGGVPICVPEEVDDDIGHIHLPAGSYDADGNQALDYVRVRHDLSENGDIGRMRRQQAFLASMAHKAISLGTLTNPVKLYSFLDAATKSLSTDEGLNSLKELIGLARQLRDIGLENIQFLTVPFEPYPPDHNRLVWAPEAKKLWRRIEHDKPLPRKLEKTVITAADTVPGSKNGPATDRPSPTGAAGPGDAGSESASPTPGASESPSAPSTTSTADPDAEAAAAARRANGLCA